MSELDAKQKGILSMLEKQLKTNKEDIERLKDKLKRKKRRIHELENELEDTRPFPAATLLGVQKNEILSKMRHLSLETLQQLEKDYCEGILGTEQIID